MKQFIMRSVVGMTGLISLGGFLTGFALNDGHALAFACLSVGVLLATVLWMHYSASGKNTIGANRFMVPMFCLTAGMALYSNLSYFLWGAGFPMAIRAIENGAMQGKFWLPPLTLFWAVLCWWQIDKSKP
jgi:hypothetical protein